MTAGMSTRQACALLSQLSAILEIQQICPQNSTKRHVGVTIGGYHIETNSLWLLMASNNLKDLFKSSG